MDEEDIEEEEEEAEEEEEEEEEVEEEAEEAGKRNTKDEKKTKEKELLAKMTCVHWLRWNSVVSKERIRQHFQEEEFVVSPLLHVKIGICAHQRGFV